MKSHLLVLLLSGVLSFAATPVLPAATFVPTAAPLFERGNCPANTFQCPTSLGSIFSDVCCQNGQSCALDSNNNAACCPSGAVCTGNAPSQPPTAAPTEGVSYVSNTYFPFPYAETTFDNNKACVSASSACLSNYDACVNNLRGDGGFGVTVVVPGDGGTTIDGGEAANLGTSATSICSSLSSEACAAIKATNCADFGSTAGIGLGRSQRSFPIALLATAGSLILLLGSPT